jgi:hypothetical protein
MGWNFPAHAFNVEDLAGATYADCRLIAEDEDTITFECVAHSSRTLMRTQLTKESIRSISWPASADKSMEGFLREL